MTDGLPAAVTILPDVNVLAIALTNDHPVHETVFPWVRDGLDGPNTLLLPGPYPLRTQYIMESHFDVERTAARNAVQSLVRSPARVVGTTESTIHAAYEISAQKDHDVYDAFLLALAREFDADYLVTTDTDFEALCAGESVAYTNPVPETDLDQLSLE